MLRKTDLDHTWLVVEIFDNIEISYFNKTNGILLCSTVYVSYTRVPGAFVMWL